MAKCTTCDAEVVHVRDEYTGATFPVDAEPERVQGYVLGRPAEGERSPRAERHTVEVYTPHVLSCEQLAHEGTRVDEEQPT